MTFNEKSGLVKVWVTLIKKGIYSIDHVPELSNLKTVVRKVLG